MAQTEIAAIRALLSGKPRPVGWAERRQRLDEVGSIWPVAEDVRLTPVCPALRLSARPGPPWAFVQESNF